MGKEEITQEEFDKKLNSLIKLSLKAVEDCEGIEFKGLDSFEPLVAEKLLVGLRYIH